MTWWLLAKPQGDKQLHQCTVCMLGCPVCQTVEYCRYGRHKTIHAKGLQCCEGLSVLPKPATFLQRKNTSTMSTPLILYAVVCDIPALCKNQRAYTKGVDSSQSRNMAPAQIHIGIVKSTLQFEVTHLFGAGMRCLWLGIHLLCTH